jgi:hypothetical protein
MPHQIKGTNRQMVTAADGTKLQRQYVYLTESIWHLLHAQARAANISVSLLITSFADHGTSTPKDTNDTTPSPSKT